MDLGFRRPWNVPRTRRRLSQRKRRNLRVDVFYEVSGSRPNRRERVVLKNTGQVTRDVVEEEYYLILLRPPQSPSNSCVPVGGRLGDFLPQWTNATSSPFIIKIIENGHKLAFNAVLPPTFLATVTCYPETGKKQEL